MTDRTQEDLTRRRRQTANAFGVTSLILFAVGTAAASGQVPQSGQKECWDVFGGIVECAGTGQDGERRQGAPWPAPRFTDNQDGTVTDNLTALVWLKDASCAELEGNVASGVGHPAPSPTPGAATWEIAFAAVAALGAGDCGLSDDSVAGQWRLPNIKELLSLIDYNFVGPALANASGTAQWTEGNVFSGVQPYPYWSSTTDVDFPASAWNVDLNFGAALGVIKTHTYFVWPVR